MTGEKKGGKNKEERNCGYQPSPMNEPCGRTLYDDEHCIFHSKDIEGKKDKFDKEFWEDEFEKQKKNKKKYDFTGFVFPGDISFNELEFEKDADFWGAQFSGKANFEDAQFSGKADFWDAQFSGEADFRDAQFSGEADFMHAQFSGVANFVGAQFSGEKLGGLFTSLRNRGIKRIREGRYKIKDFRFHLGENISKEYPVIDRMTKDAWYLDDFKANHPFIYWIWLLFADCGRSLWRWALWSLGFALYFAVNFILIDYSFTDAFRFNSPLIDRSFLTYVYYSVVTFTTLGFGDITPIISTAQKWVMAEVITGYIMLGGLISILANKLARRS